jgi:hypothetical protein
MKFLAMFLGFVAGFFSMASSANYPPFLPPPGKEFWQLGQETNARLLANLLSSTRANDLHVTSPETEARLRLISSSFNASKSPAIGADVVFMFAYDCSNPARSNALERLKLVLSLGVEPDSPVNDGRRAAHVASEKGFYELASVIGNCRPDLRAKAGALGTPHSWATAALSDAMKTRDVAKISACRQIVKLWVSLRDFL